MEKSIASDPPTLCTLPLELREEILSHLLLPEHVYTSSSQAQKDQAQRLDTKKLETYVDSRIYIPTRLPANILQICRQLREDCIGFNTRLLNSPFSKAKPGPLLQAGGSWDRTLTKQEGDKDEIIEHHHDDNMVRITLEVDEAIVESLGSYIPERIEPSPHFLSLLPLLGRLRTIKFIVWAGFNWWGSQSDSTTPKLEEMLKRARIRRTFSDQDDQVAEPSVWKPATSTPSSTDITNHDSLSKALSTLLDHLPLVSEVQIDILLHATAYLNWDLPNTKWEYVKKWLDGPPAYNPVENRAVLEKVQRRLVTVALVGSSKVFSRVFLRQLEVRLPGREVVEVRRGVCDPFSGEEEGNDSDEENQGSANSTSKSRIHDIPEVSLTNTFHRPI
ncbi:hypothetical protein P280DRAFT_517083 [Massarina eburnea CBS 473.64]|uniref:F-box domain-containing protein n=1 Tax=Massarina eburnea CBS 473.64 TaxID=1395130 RepID=A0A6A6S472_9PLEO|nr:hypothetical protein P280DRAFT_517083 [Massarina eburnea CBS 473.64]